MNFLLVISVNEIVIITTATKLAAPRIRTQLLPGSRKFEVNTILVTETIAAKAFRAFFRPQALYDGCTEFRWFRYSRLSASGMSHIGH